jgi:hypothetical protein
LTSPNRSYASDQARSRRLFAAQAGRPRRHQIFLPSKYGPAIQRRRRRALGGDERFERRFVCRPFKPARLIVKALQCLHFFFTSEFAFRTADFMTRMVSS